MAEKERPCWQGGSIGGGRQTPESKIRALADTFAEYLQEAAQNPTHAANVALRRLVLSGLVFPSVLREDDPE